MTPEYQLSNAAKQDLINIARYGDRQFGIAQSDHYRNLLKLRFTLISNQPRLYPSVEHIRKGYRRSVCGVNSIYYRIVGSQVIIERFLGMQDINKILNK